MKRITVLLIAILLLSSNIWARNPQEAANIANSFMNHRDAHTNIEQRLQAAKKTSNDNTTVDLVFTQKTADNRPALYVFNHSIDGFVVISANDDTRTILGYADNGHFDANNIPKNMQFWLQMYADEIAQSNSSYSLTINKQRKASQNKNYPQITPLLGDIQWGQNEPFNNMCPIMPRQKERAVTGCVATALSQIMAYHKHPKQGTGSYSYSYGGTTISADFNTTYDWDNMLPYYDFYATNYTQEQADAVAKLMFHVGVAANMHYSSAGSGANSQSALAALKTYFGYDASIKISPKDYIQNEDILMTIAQDLQAGYPVYMDGSTKNKEGHAFVCDGMNTDGYLHINWGWDGWSNGYFSLSALDPDMQGTGGSVGNNAYTETVCAFTGIRPDEGGSAIPTATATTITRTNSDRIKRTNSISFSIERFSNIGVITLSGKIGYNIYDTNGDFVTKAITNRTVDLAPGYYYTSKIYANTTIPYTLKDGHYKLEVGVTNAEDSIFPIYAYSIGREYHAFEIKGDSIFFQPNIKANITVDIDCNYMNASWNSEATAHKVQLVDNHGKSVFVKKTTQTSLQRYISNGIYTLYVTPMDENFTEELGYTTHDDFIVSANGECPYAITDLVVLPNGSSFDATWTCDDATQFDISLYQKNIELNEWELYQTETTYTTSFKAKSLPMGEFRLVVHALQDNVKVGQSAQQVFTIGNMQYNHTIRIKKEDTSDMDLCSGLWLWWWTESDNGQVVKMDIDQNGWYSTTIVSQNSTINCLAVNKDVTYSWNNAQETIDYVNISGDICLLIGSAKSGRYDLFETSCNEDNNCYILNITSTEGGEVTINPTSKDCYEAGTRVTLTAVPEEGYYFSKWSDGVTYAKRNVTMTQNYELQALFEAEVCYALTLNQTQGGIVVAEPNKKCYVEGKEVTLTAIADNGYTFSQWSDGNTSAQRTIVMSEDITLSAVFIANLYTLTIEAGIGGSVKKYPSNTQYTVGTEVNITATPDTGYEFVCWSDGNTAAQRTITMNENYNLTAIFRSTSIPQDHYTLTLTHNIGGVTFLNNPQEYYESGTKIIIEAIADNGYVFQGWSDGVTETTRRITITQDTIIHAAFEKDVQANQYKLTLTTDEGGKVTKTPNREAYEKGTYVLITATAKNGFEFIKWDDNNTSTERVVTMTQDIKLHASFHRLPSENDVTELVLSNSNLRIIAKWKSEAPRFDITISNKNEELIKNEIIDNTDDNKIYQTNVSKAGTYIVTIKPLDYSDRQIGYEAADTITLIRKYSLNIYADYGGIVNDSVNGEYEQGKSIDIVATPNNGFRFLTWDDGDTNATRTLVMDQDYSLVASFKRIPTYTLNIYASDHGVASIETGAYSYQENEVVKLLPIPNEGYLFAHWMINGTEDTTSEITLVMTQNYDVYPVFKPLPTYTLTILPSEFGMASIAPGTYTYSNNFELTLTPIADENYLFDQWKVNDEIMYDSILVLIMNQDYTIMPIFKPNFVGIENLSYGENITIQHHTIIVETTYEQNLMLYDITGHLLEEKQNARIVHFTVPNAGVYILRTHNQFYKIRVE